MKRTRHAGLPVNHYSDRRRFRICTVFAPKVELPEASVEHLKLSGTRRLRRSSLAAIQVEFVPGAELMWQTSISNTDGHVQAEMCVQPSKGGWL